MPIGSSDSIGGRKQIEPESYAFRLQDALTDRGPLGEDELEEESAIKLVWLHQPIDE